MRWCFFLVFIRNTRGFGGKLEFNYAVLISGFRFRFYEGEVFVV